MSTATTPVVTVAPVVDPLPAAVAEEIRERLGERTTYWLIKESGLPRASVYRWIRGDFAISINDLGAAATALGTTASELLAAAEARLANQDEDYRQEPERG